MAVCKPIGRMSIASVPIALRFEVAFAREQFPLLC